MDGRTTDLHTHFAGFAALRIDSKRWIVFDLFEQGTRTPGNNDRRFLRCQFFFQYRFQRSQLVRVDYPYPFHACRLADFFDAHLWGRLVFQGQASGRVLLMAGHAGDRIVKHQNGRMAAVVGNVNQPSDPRMDKCAVTDYRHRFLRGIPTPRLVESV